MPIDKRIFNKGLDTDSDDRLIQQGFYRDALNIRVSSSDGPNVGAINAVKGNFQKSNILDNIESVTIGSYLSEQRDSIIWFVWRADNQHMIFEYTHATDEYVLVLQNSILNFDRNHLITGINDIDGLLYWTDDYNPPRKINIDKAIKHTESNGEDLEGYSSLLSDGSLLEREQFISAIKAQPVQRPSYNFVTDSTKDYNLVRRGKYFKFKYRYVYDDNEKSAWSGISDITYTDYDILESTSVEFNEFSFNNISLYNAIVVSFLNGHETVSRIQVAASESDSDFFLIADVDKNDSVNVQSITFYNDGVYTSLDVNDSIKPFDDLPRLAKAQELIDGNKIAYGNYLSGYDHHDVRASLSVDFFEPTFILSLNQNNFGPTVYLNSDYILTSYEVSDGFQGQDYGQYGKLRATGPASSEQAFKEHLLELGYDLQPGMTVEIEYSLGLTQQPTSLSPINPYAAYIGPNTNNVSLSPESLLFEIPDNVDDAYFNLYEQLNDYQMSGTTGTLGFMSRGGIWRRYNTSEYRDVLTLDDAAERIDNVISGVGFFERVYYRTVYDPVILLGGDGIFFPELEFYFDSVPGLSRANVPFQLFQVLISNENNGKTHGKVGVYSFRLRTFSNTPNGLTETYGFPRSNAFSTFKSGSYHTFGIAYHDDYGRFGFVNSPIKKFVPHLNDRGDVDVDNVFGAKINWNLEGYAPSWAKYYSWFYSGNSRGYEFLQFVITEITETDNVDSVTNSVVRVTLRLLSEYQSQNDNARISYDFSDGDRIRFIKKPNGDAFTQNVDLEIISAQDGTAGEYILTIPRTSILDSVVEYSGCMVEIYKRYSNVQEDKQIFREISDKYPVNQVSFPDGTLVGVHTVTNGTFMRGDVYITQRNIFGNNAPTTFICETPNISDFHNSSYRDGGRANAFDREQGEERYISQVTYSMPYISGTNINGLSNFNPVVQPFKEYDRKNGKIQKLFSRDNELLIFQEDKVNRSMVSRNVIFDNQGNGTLVGTTAETLSDAVSYQGDFGISRQPESFAEYGGRIYFADAKRGAILRLSRDGLTEISSNLMGDYFMDELTDNINNKIFGGFNPIHGEYVINIGGGHSIAFDESSNLWTSKYSYIPETMLYMYKNMYSFKNGEIYVHDTTETYNMFYNTIYDSYVKFVSNIEPSEKKVYHSISLESDKAMYAMIESPSGQYTELYTSDFVEREGYYYSIIYRDVNTPNVDNTFIEGDVMRDYAMIITLGYSGREAIELFAANLNITKSYRHNG